MQHSSCTVSPGFCLLIIRAPENLHAFTATCAVYFSQAYGYELPKDIEYLYTKVRKTHNSGVFDAYTDEMKRARKSGILTGLPDGYGRGRIIGDYRRVALYGVDRLIEAKKADLKVSPRGRTQHLALL